MDTTENEIRITERNLVTKLADRKLEATRKFVVHFGSMCAGVLVSVGAAMMSSGTLAVILVAVGMTMIGYGAAGAYAYERLLRELEGQKDVVRITEGKDPSVGPTSRPFVAKPGVKNNTILVGPMSLTTAQWRIIWKRIDDGHMFMSRQLYEGIGIKNLNARYGEFSKWMLENGMIEDTEPGKRYPKYKLLAPGVRLFEDAISGKSRSG